MATLDGRARRSTKTRKVLIDAYLDIVRGSGREPTATELAERVNCSPRTVFERFGSLATLSAAAMDELIDACHLAAAEDWIEHHRLDRIRLHADARARACEAWSTLWRLAARQQGQSETLDRRLGEVRHVTRQSLERLFRHELDSVAGPVRAALLVALEAVVDYGAWERLREVFSPAEATEAWVHAIDRLLPPTPAGGI